MIPFNEEKRMRLKLPYALRDGKPICISEIPIEKRGLKCGCFCPYCNEPVQARIGTIKTPHFAHQTADCDHEGAIQSMLHILSKKILSESMLICLPTCVW